MKSSRNALIFVTICLAILGIISAYLAYSQANILDRYIKRLLVEPDFSQFGQSNYLIIGFSFAILVGQYFCWWLMGRWLGPFVLDSLRGVWHLIPVTQVVATYKRATHAWSKLEYLAKEADEYHRPQPWVRFKVWFWSLVVALPIIGIGAVWLACLPATPALMEVASKMSYALTILTVGHALVTLGLLFTIAVVGQLEAKINQR